MYGYNHYSRRRQEGWAERRRYFRRLTETDNRTQAAPKPRPEAPDPAKRG